MVIIETAIALVLIFAVLVMFHEFGHFLAARLVGIRVEEFAIGFGPKLITLFKRGDTEYTVHPYPLGGFVKLAGMEPGQEDILDGFQAQSIWKRALVIFAGPFASFVLAVLVFLMLYVYWGYPDMSKPLNAVGMVSPKTEASRIGLKAGDKILEINGVKVTKGMQVIRSIHKKADEKVTLLVERNGKKMTKTATPRWRVQFLGVPWSFMNSDSPVVDSMLPVSLNKKLGIEKDDMLVSINGEIITGGKQMIDAIKANDGKRVELTLKRNGKTITREVTPTVEWVRFLDIKWGFPGGYAEPANGNNTSKTAKDAGIKISDQIVSLDGKKITTGRQMLEALNDSKGKKVVLEFKHNDDKKTASVHVPVTEAEHSYYESIGLLGFVPQPSIQKMGFREAIAMGLTDTLQKIGLLVQTLTSERIKEDVGGPILIASVTASSVALGPYWVFQMLGGLSLSLAFINLIPIPVLDGGHIAILGIEAIRRKRLTPEQMAAVQMAGLAIIGVLIIIILFSDITKIITNSLPQ